MSFKYTFLLALLGFCFFAKAQKDSGTLKEVVVNGYYNPQPLQRATAAVSLVDSNVLKNQPQTSFVSVLNTVPGLRMEERSPGSYRLSLRGSLLRSPFGIRNIKIYMDDFPLTDAGGNSYLNVLDPAAITSLEIYKGPEASIYGAGTGGAIIINPINASENNVQFGITGGSYGLLHQKAGLQQQYKNYNFSIAQSYQRSDGYRENSAFKRNYLQTKHNWNYSPKGSLKVFLFYSDLYYQTPGGLTSAQMEINPKAARAATATLPGAVTQKAAIYNKTFYAGLSNTYHLSNTIKHVLAVYAAGTDFKNPFITNYEKRREQTYGLRSFMEWSALMSTASYKLQGGVEAAITKTTIDNFDNNKGTPGNMQASDKLQAKQSFGFARLQIDVHEKLLIELGSSINFFKYQYETYFPQVISEQQRKFAAEWMPKVAASWLVAKGFTVRMSAGRGYSPPTIAELRSSDNMINNNLQAELGWNYEAGIRYKTSNNRFSTDITGFYFRLNNAIVRRLNNNDIEYFINAGGTNQKGLEVQNSFWLIPVKTNRFIQGLQWRNSYTYSHFRFRNFISGNTDFSGKSLTGVPAHVLINSFYVQFPEQFYLFAQHNFTSAIPLNDANTFSAKAYHLVELKTGIRNIKLGKMNLELYVGINNMLNQQYSLGNDLNAAGNRYFNPAAGINYYGGFTVAL